jgi:ribosomal protein S8
MQPSLFCTKLRKTFMVLLFTHQNSQRIHYIFSEVLSVRFGFTIEITTDWEYFQEKPNTFKVLYTENQLDTTSSNHNLWVYNSGLLQGYSALDSNKVIIYVRKVFNKTLTRELKLISTPKTKVSLDYKAIIRLKKNTNSLMFFSTDQGLFTINECKKNKIGGVLLFIC